MNLTNMLSSIGLGDGQGNTSLMRVVVLVLVIAVLVPALVAALTAHTNLTLTADNLELIGLALGAKCVQNAQENAQPKPNP